MRESALLFRGTKARVLTRNLLPGYLRKGTLIMANNRLGWGLIPIALPLFLLIPFPAFACDYTDIFCSLKNTFHSAVNRYVGESEEQGTKPQLPQRQTDLLTPHDVHALRHYFAKGQTQSEKAILDRYGYPAHRGQAADIYETWGGMVTIFYNGNRAVGYVANVSDQI